MAYEYDRSKTAILPATSFDEFRKHLNHTLLAAQDVKKFLERDKRSPKKVKAMADMIKELLEIREDMLWVATEKGDGVRTRR